MWRRGLDSSSATNTYQGPVQDAIGLWSNRNEPLVLLISGPYAASRVEMLRESRDVVPAMGFTRSEIYIFNGMI